MPAPALRRRLALAGVALGLLLATRADAAGGFEVTLLSAGEAPHTTVRLSPAVGSRERVVIEGESTTTVTLSLMPDPEPQLGSNRTVLLLHTTAVTPDGTVTAAIEVVEASQTGGAALNDRPGIEGTAGTLTMLSDGTITDVTLTAADLGEAELAGLVESARRMTTPFPTEPIGVGALWTVQDLIDLGVVRIALVTTCQLISLEGGRATIASTTTASADETELALDDEGIRATLTELVTRGASTWTQSLDAIAPSARTADGRYEVSVKGRKGLIPFKLRLETDAISRASASPLTP